MRPQNTRAGRCAKDAQRHLMQTLGSYMKFRPSNSKKYIKSRWPLLTEKQLQTVIRTAAARERNRPRHTKLRYRNTRLDAVKYYKQKFGDCEFLLPYSDRKLPQLQRYWLPAGYAHFLTRFRND